MIDLIRKEFDNNDAITEFEDVLQHEGLNEYQRAFRILHARKGQSTVNKIVRLAVWNSLDLSNWPSELPQTSAGSASSAVCTSLEGDIAAWYLPTSVETLGRLLVNCSDVFGQTVLTTNFDPLIEISITKHGGAHYRTSLDTDGLIGKTHAEGTHVVHLHGYWHGVDTLHTPQQLTTPRRQLSSSLAHVLKGSTLVVLGYGGWDDVITSTLEEVVSDSNSNAEIVWAFHDSDPDRIVRENEQLLKSLEPGIGRGRVSLFNGVDCKRLLSSVYDQIESNYATSSRSHVIPQVHSKVTEQVNPITGGRGMRVQIDFPLEHPPVAKPDRPLFAECWVGR